MSIILSKVFRNETLESVHRGSIVVMDGEGKTIASAGDPDRLTFWRSAAKFFQTLPCVTSGAADAFGFSDKELALACASHSGEQSHVELAEGMLRKADFTEADLLCGAHKPFDEESNEALIKSGTAPSQLHNNCSGKHSAMLAFAKHIGADPGTYLDRENEIQKIILSVISDFTEVPEDEIQMGTDGCSAPNFAIPLSAMAKAYSKLVMPRDHNETTTAAIDRLVRAKMQFPEMVGGRSRLDTLLMKSMRKSLVCKVGAEGVWTAGLMPSDRWKKGLSIALKIEDGNDFRARPAVVIELLRRLEVITPEAEEAAGEFSPQILRNARDTAVGRVTADFEMKFYD